MTDHCVELPPQFTLYTQVEVEHVHLSWTVPKSYASLFYRLDGMYNNREEFSITVVNQEYNVPILDSTDHLSLIISSISINGVKQITNQINIWPKKSKTRIAQPSVNDFFVENTLGNAWLSLKPNRNIGYFMCQYSSPATFQI